jgi:serine/threonine protein phosphatase PrpC
MMSLDERPPDAEPTTREELPTVEGRGPRVRVDFDSVTHPGKVRANNEDHYLVAKLAKSMRICQTSLPEDHATRFSDEEGYLMIVADGMGGAAAGEMASALAVRTVENFVLDTLKWFLHVGKEQSALAAELRLGLERADREVMERAHSDGRLAGMGTTLTMAYSVSTDLYLVHAGDSRAYLFRDGHLEQVTRDHTYVQMLVDQGQLSPEAAKQHQRRNVVTNVIGGPNSGVYTEIHKARLADGDVLLLCSDGLTEPVDDPTITEVLARNLEPKDICRLLLQLALDRGAPDNVTLVVARYAVG